MRRRTIVVGLAAVTVAFAGCGESPTAPDEDLLGLWNLAFQEEPAIWGFVSAQVIFRDDASFTFVGSNPLSMGPLGLMTITGTWSRTGDTVILRTSDETRTFQIEFDDGGVVFTEAGADTRFRLFRPLPD